MRHVVTPGCWTTRPGEKALGEYEIWLADGDIVRTYSSRHKLGTQRPIRTWPRGLDDPDIPGASKVYEPLTALPMETLPETFIHPAGYRQERAVHRRVPGHRPGGGPRARDDRADLLAPADDRDDGRPAGFHDPDRRRSRYRSSCASPSRWPARSPGTPRSSTWSPIRHSSRRPSTSSSRRGRRCSTDGAGRQPEQDLNDHVDHAVRHVNAGSDHLGVVDVDAAIHRRPQEALADRADPGA